ncbi:hypothetical protein NEOLEDRAFT_37108 [Neolentinus lepideus HHB14362 ss-1]|uniref:Uncharacterized protein n=1 Tax=Neolentinus lepideus HHB14362 ss-1 TaxID=1314782 RepID=A0A165W836_9AGAM|nr:hypothetical protein NEOLEDRAFT_37108 [Neolentinus lepideus HHB14362 ss-1]
MDNRHSPSLRKRRLLGLVFGFTVFTFVLYFQVGPLSEERAEEHRASLGIQSEYPSQSIVQCDQPQVKDEDKFDPLSYLVGAPTSSFRDNLRNDTKYITSWYGAGWTNDVMTMGNLIYLAKITDRIPIIPAFTPETHVGTWEVPGIPFGEVFDVPRLKKDLGFPVLEWHQVKDPNSEEIDEFGCWSVWTTVSSGPDGQTVGPRMNRAVYDIGLDISYTAVPDWVREGSQSHTRFWKLAPLTFPENRARNLGQPLPSPQNGALLPPDEQLACFDYLYYVTAFEDFEYEKEYSPGWRYALQHFRWTPKMETLAMYYLRRALKVSPSSDIPPYIAIHARHGDFDRFCGEVPDGILSSVYCFVSVSTIAEAVSQAQQEILERDGVSIPNEHVVMTSDERDPAWWDLVASHGFTWVDYKREKVVEILGPWYPTFIDAIIQSGGAGFVGTEASTMSLIAARRIRDWHGGIARFVPWGPPT